MTDTNAPLTVTHRGRLYQIWYPRVPEPAPVPRTPYALAKLADALDALAETRAQLAETRQELAVLRLHNARK